MAKSVFFLTALKGNFFFGTLYISTSRHQERRGILIIRFTSNKKSVNRLSVVLGGGIGANVASW